MRAITRRLDWPFSKLAELWGGRGFRAHTPRQFRDALDAAFAEEKRFSLIEVGLQPGDISPILRGFVHAVKTRVHAEIRGKRQGARDKGLLHLPAMLLLAVLSIVWTWPLALHFGDHIPGLGGDNYSFLWNLWWMRKALSAPELDFFQSTYLFSPFGVDLINHPHTALQGYLSATALVDCR